MNCLKGLENLFYQPLNGNNGILHRYKNIVSNIWTGLVILQVREMVLSLLFFTGLNNMFYGKRWCWRIKLWWQSQVCFLVSAAQSQSNHLPSSDKADYLRVNLFICIYLSTSTTNLLITVSLMCDVIYWFVQLNCALCIKVIFKKKQKRKSNIQKMNQCND